MKKSFSILVMLLFAVNFLIAQETKKEENTNPNAPEITFTKTTHDYGTISVGGDGSSVFEFTNTGKEPLILSSVRSSCGCTVPSWPREPILPGKKESIKVKYDTGRIGPINKTITVVSNAKTSTVVLRITGTVVKETAAAPEKTLTPGAAPTAK